MDKPSSQRINQYWTDIYYHLHYRHTEQISHQAIRLLQHLDFQGKATVGELADFLSVGHNTASEHIKRLIEKGWLKKLRSAEDERRVFVEITASGKGVLQYNTQLNEEKLATILARLTEEEAATIGYALSILSREAQACSQF
ncbi:MarR family transcriptional regulator [Salicibibacter cibi]|uniref:MarR family transcriptional regulator n=1 Tax=Salicibibacter cibi TaxID=2743001 RepID=A0A7T7CEQ9_9BACI|nr:winged helix DNA-binding protein [Salicibibacter cibi]QQK79308.1 MarR family transcriptional regulator [Salicibibacter cibi]